MKPRKWGNLQLVQIAAACLRSNAGCYEQIILGVDGKVPDSVCVSALIMKSEELPYGVGPKGHPAQHPIMDSGR